MSRKASANRHKPEALTPLESRFCHEYCVDYQAGPALKRAGSKAKFADQQAYEMLRKPHIAAEIQRIIAGQNEKAHINKQWIMNELALQYRAASAAAAVGNTAERRIAVQCLEKLGQHVDVNAFRAQIGLGNPDGSEMDLSGLTDEQLDQLEKLLEIAALAEPSEGGKGETIQ